MRPSHQRHPDVQRMTAPAGMLILLIVQPQRPVRVTKYPGADRAKHTSHRLGILVEDICKMSMFLDVVELQDLFGVFHGLPEIARPIVAGTGGYVSSGQ